MMGRLIIASLIVSTMGCVPDFLQKYRKDSASKDESVSAPADALTPPSDMAPGIGTNQKSRSNGGGRKSDAPARATIYALDRQTYRFHLREEEVWNTALDVLMKNYNVNIVEKQSGIITTEWDSFYLNNLVYRNKLSMRFRRQNSGVIDLTVMNNVERLRDASTAGSGVGAVWLPAPDAANEVTRIIQNMALLLRQPPPVLPPGAVSPGNAMTETGTEYIEKAR